MTKNIKIGNPNVAVLSQDLQSKWWHWW